MSHEPGVKRRDVSVVITAAGVGARLGLGPKALLELDRRPLVVWVTRKALFLSDDVVVAVPPGHGDVFRRLCPECRCLEGGATRQESVARLVKAARGECLVLVDVARPFFSKRLMGDVLASAQETGAAAAVLEPDAPIGLLSEHRVVRCFHRNEVGLFQTPQAYSRTLLEDVLAEALRLGWKEQSIVQLFLLAGHPVTAVPGEPANIKVTTPLDWRMAHLLSKYLR